MKKFVTVSLVLVFTLGLIVSCTPESLTTDDNNIQLVDKDKNVRPGNQGTTDDTDDTDVADAGTGSGN